MKSRTFVRFRIGLVIVALGGCNRTDKPRAESAARADACTSALRSFDRFVDTGDAAEPPDQRAKVKAAVLERCVVDMWSDHALTCMQAAASSHVTLKCWADHLTEAQRNAVSRALGTLTPQG
jgi:hypothetical protein